MPGTSYDPHLHRSTPPPNHGLPAPALPANLPTFRRLLFAWATQLGEGPFYRWPPPLFSARLTRSFSRLSSPNHLGLQLVHSLQTLHTARRLARLHHSVRAVPSLCQHNPFGAQLPGAEYNTTASSCVPAPALPTLADKPAMTTSPIPSGQELEPRRPRSAQTVSVNIAEGSEHNGRRFQLQVSECVETKTVTTTTRLTRKFPRVFLRDPAPLETLDTKEYPLALKPTPPELLEFSYEAPDEEWPEEEASVGEEEDDVLPQNRNCGQEAAKLVRCTHHHVHAPLAAKIMQTSHVEQQEAATAAVVPLFYLFIYTDCCQWMKADETTDNWCSDPNRRQT